MHDYIIWILVVLYAAHILEEYMLDWRTWAEKTSGLSVSWTAFFLVNAAVIILGIACAQVGWKLPEFSLIFPALMLVNTLVHLAPMIKTRKYSPGVISALCLFIPGGLITFYAAQQDGILTLQVVIISSILAIVIMAFPVVLMMAQKKIPSGN